MANLASAKKAIRQQARKQVMNLRRKRELKDARQELVMAASSGDEKAVSIAMSRVYQVLDKSSKTGGYLHKNTVARKKSRFAKLAKSLQTAK